MRHLPPLCLTLLCAVTACDPRPVRPAEEVPASAAHPTQDVPAPPLRAEAPAPAPAPACVDVDGITACPTAALLDAWARVEHVAEPDEKTLAAPLDPPDPVAIEDGLSLYERLLRGAARRTRTYLDLWTNTPTLTEAEVARFSGDAELWAKVVDFRAAASGRQQQLLGAAIRQKDRALLRALLLRSGVFYVEDPDTAVYAAKRVTLGHLFDEPQLELRRAGRVYLLERGAKGVYLHREPVLDDARAALYLLDQVGPPGSLPEVSGYALQELRRTHGLANVDAAEETAAGRSASARFFNGRTFPARLVRGADGKGRLGVVAEPEPLAQARAASIADRKTICDLLNVADVMLREDLPFDEPKVEYGQQDGYLRWRFAKAHAAGKTTYTMNGVTYQVYDRDGRPIVPQLCIDFITDTVDRFHGAWWEAEGSERKPHEFSIRDYMPYRTVRSLLAFAGSSGSAASVLTLPADQHVPYEERERFFDNLWRWREQVRVGDVIVIYGLRPDNQNHYHSFYIRETDPLHGVPLVMVANAGHAHDHAWHEVMWESPKRSIRHFVRWNPDWLRSPRAVDAADAIAARARELSTP